MHLRTSKRYRRQRHHQRSSVGCKPLLIGLVVVGIGVGWLLWQNPWSVRDTVIGEMDGIADTIQTQNAPAPDPTATPDLRAARTSCETASRQGDIAVAFEQCRVLAESSPNDVDLHYQITGMLVFNSDLGAHAQRLDRALAFADKTINANPEHPAGWAMRALVLDWRDDLLGALAAGLHARALDPSYAPAYAFLGEIYHDLGKDDLALNYLSQAELLDMDGMFRAYILRMRGKIHSDHGDWLNAIDSYTAAHQQAPNASYIAVELANNYIVSGQAERAVELLTPLLQHVPYDTALLFTLASAHTNLGAYDWADEYYWRCLDVDPVNITCLGRLGRLQYDSGDYAAAIISLEGAIQSGSDHAGTFWRLGKAYSARGQCDRAVTYWRQGYQIAIENENTAQQADFVTSLQDCGVIVNSAE